MSRIKVKMENNRFRLNFLIPLLCWTVLFQFLIEAFETELNGGIWVSWKLETEKTKEQICNQDCLKLDGKYIKGISAFWRFFWWWLEPRGTPELWKLQLEAAWTPDWGLRTHHSCRLRLSFSLLPALLSRDPELESKMEYLGLDSSPPRPELFRSLLRLKF